MPSRPIDRCLALGKQLLVLVAVATATIAAKAEEAFDEPRLLREKPATPARIGTASLSPFQPVGVTTRMRRTLLQFDALVADEAWADAIDLVEQLQNESGEELLKLPPPAEGASPLEETEGHTLYVPLAQRCQQLLATLAEDGLAEYRDRVDRTASDRLAEATSRLDEGRLKRLVDEYLASEPAAEALLALSELALERGDSAGVRRAINRLDPVLSGPYGRPAGVTLSLLDRDADPVELATAWKDIERPANPIATRANDALVAMALSRLALASLREGDLRRAQAETVLLRGMAHDAVGRLAGREQPLADALQAMLDAARSTSSSSQAADVLPTYAWAWEGATPVQPEPPPATPAINNRIRFQIRGRNQQPLFQQLANLQQPATQPPATFVGVVTSGLDAFYVERNELKHLDLATGEAEPFSLPGFDSDEDDTPRPELGDIAANGFVFGNGRAIQFPAGQGVIVRGGTGPVTRIDSQLALVKNMLYARVLRVTPSRRNVRNAPNRVEEVLIGKRIGSPDDAIVRFLPPQAEPAANAQAGVAAYRFAGPPTVRRNRLYVALARAGVRTDVSIACYAADSGRRIWTTELGAGEPLSRATGEGNLSVAVAGDTVYAATNLGAIAALDASTGNLRWIACYPRDREPTVASRGSPTITTPGTCVVVGDRVIATPSDSTRLLAWDAGTGRPLWEVQRGDAEISGIADDPDGALVLLCGRQVAAYDSLTGELRFQWPESRRAGLRGVGKAALVSGELLWPTAGALYALDPATGGLTRPPIDLTPIGVEGASIVPTAYGPLVCGTKRLRLLAELPDVPTPPKSEPKTGVSRLMESEPAARTAQLSRP